MTTTSIKWKRVASFWVPGEPVPQPRPKARAMKMGSKWTAQVYNPKSADGWKQLVSCYGAGRIAHPLDEPCRVEVAFYCPRIKGLMRKRDPDGPVPNMTRPDVDNYAKAVIDAMQDSGWFVDDSRIVELVATKLYHAKGGKPGAMIEVSVIDNPEQESPHAE
jgi:Holliday junction resolvase RusA-like endonuclease